MSILRIFARSRALAFASLLTLLLLSLLPSPAPAADKHTVQRLKITVLVTNVAGDIRAGDGEWGFAALVEVDGHRFLYDTGASADLVLRNARVLKVDLSNIEDLVLSHNHADHVGGLMALRTEFSHGNPAAFSRVHVGARIFEPRLSDSNEDHNGMKSIRAEYLATGGEFIVHDGPFELYPGVWLAGPVPRPNNEKNWSPGLWLETSSGRVEDNVPEDMPVMFETAEGTVILTGCGHAGVVNIAQYARHMFGPQPLLAIVGGIHLFAASDETLAWTASRLKSYGLKYLLAAHCTGFEATYRLRALTGLSRKSAVVAAVGSSYTLGQGIDPLALAH